MVRAFKHSLLSLLSHPDNEQEKQSHTIKLRHGLWGRTDLTRVRVHYNCFSNHTSLLSQLFLRNQVNGSLGFRKCWRAWQRHSEVEPSPGWKRGRPKMVDMSKRTPSATVLTSAKTVSDIINGNARLTAWSRYLWHCSDYCNACSGPWTRPSNWLEWCTGFSYSAAWRKIQKRSHIALCQGILPPPLSDMENNSRNHFYSRQLRNVSFPQSILFLAKNHWRYTIKAARYKLLKWVRHSSNSRRGCDPHNSFGAQEECSVDGNRRHHAH